MMSTKNTKPVISFALFIFSDGSYEKVIRIDKGSESLASQVVSSMMTGKLAQSVMEDIKKNYPKQYEEIENGVDQLYGEYLQQVEEVMKSQKNVNAPVIRATDVFGGKK